MKKKKRRRRRKEEEKKKKRRRKEEEKKKKKKKEEEADNDVFAPSFSLFKGRRDSGVGSGSGSSLGLDTGRFLSTKRDPRDPRDPQSAFSVCRMESAAVSWIPHCLSPLSSLFGTFSHSLLASYYWFRWFSIRLNELAKCGRHGSSADLRRQSNGPGRHMLITYIGSSIHPPYLPHHPFTLAPAC